MGGGLQGMLERIGVASTLFYGGLDVAGLQMTRALSIPRGILKIGYHWFWQHSIVELWVAEQFRRAIAIEPL